MKLLELKPEEIQKLVDDMEKQVLVIKKSAFQFSWYMRGGVSYVDALNMSNDERELMNEIINSNLETTKNTKMPFF